MSDQKTLSLIKPDAVERNLIGKIIDIFETNGIVIEKIKKFMYQMNLQRNFTMCIKTNLFLKSYVTI